MDLRQVHFAAISGFKLHGAESMPGGSLNARNTSFPFIFASFAA
jgi:hypothetical protein